MISVHHKFIENDKIEEGTLLNATNNSLDLFDYHLEKCGVYSFKKLEHTQIHNFYQHIEKDVEDEDDLLVEEDDDLIETIFCNGTMKVVKIFNRKCVICYEKDSVYAFRQCGHQCICKQCFKKIKVVLIY